MWNPSPVVTFNMRGAGPLDRPSPPATEWQLLQAADVVRLLMRIPRVNLLLVGVEHEMWQPLDVRLIDLHEPIVTWSPGERLSFPERTQLGTLILHDVDALSHDDQRQLFEWLEPAGRYVRVISTTSVPLFPRVETGDFSDELYYRLNTLTLGIGRLRDLI